MQMMPDRHHHNKQLKHNSSSLIAYKQVPLVFLQNPKDSLFTCIENSMELLREHGIICIRGKFPNTQEQLPRLSPNASLALLVTQRLGSLQRKNRIRLRQMNGLTLWLTCRRRRGHQSSSPSLSKSSWRDWKDDPEAFQALLEEYEAFCERAKNTSIQYINYAAFSSKICLICGKSIKRLPKIKCSLCLRQFHLPCLGDDAPIQTSNSSEFVPWYCDHCICFPMETLPFSAPSSCNPNSSTCRESPISTWNQLVECDEQIVDKYILPHLNGSEASSSSSSSSGEAISTIFNEPSHFQSASSDSHHHHHQYLPDAETFESLYLASINDEANNLEVWRAAISISPTTELLLADSLVKDERNLISNHPECSMVSGPWISCGTTFSTYEWHVEEQFLFSGSLLRQGKPRIWYCIPHAYFDEVKDILQEFFPCQAMSTGRPVPKHFYMLDPNLLPKHVPVYRCIQEPGDLIICYPKAFHSSISLGLHASEVVNLAPREWLKFATAESLDDLMSESWRTEMKVAVEVDESI